MKKQKNRKVLNEVNLDTEAPQSSRISSIKKMKEEKLLNYLQIHSSFLHGEKIAEKESEY